MGSRKSATIVVSPGYSVLWVIVLWPSVYESICYSVLFINTSSRPVGSV